MSQLQVMCVRPTIWNTTFSCIFEGLVLFVAVIEFKLLVVSFLLQSTAFSHLAVHITVLVKERHRIFGISHTFLDPGLVWIDVQYFVSLLVCQP